MHSINRLNEALINLVIGWPRIILILFLAATALLGSQAVNFQIDASPDTLLTRDNELYVQTQLVGQRFAPQEFLLVTYTPTNFPLFSERTFSALRSLSEDLLALDRVTAVRSILNVPVFMPGTDLLEQDIDLATMTIEAGNFSQNQLQEVFSDHPIYENLLVNEDLSATALQVVFEGNDELAAIDAQLLTLTQRFQAGEMTEADEQERGRLEAEAEPLRQQMSQIREREIESIRAIIDENDDNAEIHLGGVHVLAYQLIQIIVNDLIVFGSAIAIGIFLMLALLFRGWRWVAIPMLCCLTSVLTTIGLFALLDIKATVISSNFIALQLILTLAIVIHLIVQYRELAHATDMDNRELIRETLRHKIGPCFFAGITTSVGFGSLVFSGIQPVISFGWMMIIAMFVSILVSLILFPVLLALFPVRQVREERRTAVWFVSLLSRFSLRQPLLVGLLSIALAAASITGLMKLTVENSFINYFKDTTRVHQELAYIDQEFGGSTPLDLMYTTPDLPDNPDLVMSAQTVQMLQLIQHRLQEHEAIGRVLSPVNVTDLARQLNNDAPLTEYELTAAYWMMDEEFREELLGAFYNPESGETRINIWIQDLTPGLNRQDLLAQLHADMADMGIEESQYQFTNMFVLYQDILEQLFESQILTLGLVYVALLLTFMLIFRSVRIAIAAIIPNILSTLAILGLMGWLNIPLDLMTITIAAIAMGIAVDDTIHFIDRYLEESREHAYAEAIARTHQSVGVAILYTSLLIIAGFSMLGLSDFVPSVLFGLLTALAMLLALLTGLCLLPVLLRLLYRPPQVEAAAPLSSPGDSAA